MKTKSLIKKFSYDEILEQCKKQGWRLPTLAEADSIDTEHEYFWISDTPKPKDIKTHALLYCVDSEYVATVNKINMYPVIVIKEDRSVPIADMFLPSIPGYEVYSGSLLEVGEDDDGGFMIMKLYTDEVV